MPKGQNIISVVLMAKMSEGRELVVKGSVPVPDPGRGGTSDDAKVKSQIIWESRELSAKGEDWYRQTRLFEARKSAVRTNSGLQESRLKDPKQGNGVL